MPSRGFIFGFRETHTLKETFEVKCKCCSYVTRNGWEQCLSNGPSDEQPTKPPGRACTEDENLCDFFCLDGDVQLENEVAPCLLSFSKIPRLCISFDRRFYGSVNDLTVSFAAVRLCPQRSELTKQPSWLLGVAEGLPEVLSTGFHHA